jgi:hypothetical protein
MASARESERSPGVPLGAIVLTLVAIQFAVIAVFAWRLHPGLF